MNVSFILFEPQTPENIGASARAIKTMGFNDLRLVNPANDYLGEKARKLAYGSEDTLEQATVFTSLSEAVKGIDFIIATSAKRRTARFDYHPSSHILDLIERKGDAISSAAIVFGREDRGLENDQIELCHLVSYVPIVQAYPSLNLAQAVMIYAYSLSPLNQREVQVKETKEKGNELNSLIEKISKILTPMGLGTNTLLYGRIMERVSVLNEEDIRILHSVVSKLNEKNSRC
jgi:tRNA/rRNA methyltransferase